ncbi:class I SAM-dependent methyltransferase [Trujillonella endophytica]|uniref:2-polyprenyl-3-methyl-5-hydroxy-6-metoxy-1,4-benzoquinol methylase n=1 Tax=Trujillonella endophytica TaxID=673521 RepID=A0A1H8W0P3_9ACTN|nr:class I SAM-dependent methyltransferase [Trujillella endophytica]SEP21154.1 2-polyprenyl-3-methyl-5-hydroxy-6-metoxy-1,4-benzoquinol methylase [Trujillella endophytica]
MTDAAAERSGPSLEEQRRFWGEWNLALRAYSDRSPLQLRQLHRVRRAATRLAASTEGNRPLRILDLGCGTGWLGASLTDLGEVRGIDLAPAAVEHAKQEFPLVHFVAGDFSDAALTGPFDLVVSSEVIAHVADQPAYVRRAADLLRPGGVFLLMSQNPYVWRRWTQLKPTAEGMLRKWPELKELRGMLAAAGFSGLRVRSLQPAGDRGVLRVLNSRIVRGGCTRVGLERPWRWTLERMLLGRDLAIEARRR